MKNRRTALCLAALGLAMASGTAQADVLVEQLPDYVNAFFSDYTGGWPDQEVAENFVLGSSDTVGQVGFWGVYFPNNVPSDAFTVNIYADAGNLPGALLSSQTGSASRVDTGVDAFGVDVYEYNMVLSSPFAAAGGVQYWVSVVNSTNSGPANSWGWVTSAADTLGAFSADSTGTWNPLGASSSLRLQTVVPAPASLALAGLMGLGAMRRRR
jgi:hypothetical protein